MIYFRVDSNTSISAGHVMRCLAIAQALQARDVPCMFFCADEEPVGLIKSNGFECTVLNGDWRDLSIEIPRLARLLQGDAHAVLVVDTYSVDGNYVAKLCKFARICYLGSKPLIAPELSLLVNYSTKIDQSFYTSAYQGSSTKLCLGPRYAPLRREFSAGNPSSSDKVRSVLITTGNTDNDGFVDALLTSLLASKSLSSIHYDVVVGPLFKNVERLESRYGDLVAVDLLRGIGNMSGVMKRNDLAVSACGTTLYELAACGVPTVGFSLVPEQSESGDSLCERGVIEYAGGVYEGRSDCIRRIIAALERLVANKDERCDLARKFHGLSDGFGCDRICDELLSLYEN